MQERTMAEAARKIASFNGIDVFYIEADKFKTNIINVFFHDTLSKDNVTKNALLPAVLRRGCKSYPSLKEIALYLEELYGAVFDCGVAKKGECQIARFYIEYVADRYTGENINLFEKVFNLLFEIITAPVLEGGRFVNDYVEQEKENLKKLIDARINDKVQYALERCLEEMCREEPFGIYEYGSVSDLESINSQNLYEYYLNILETLPVSVYISGSIELHNIEAMIKKLASIRRGAIKEVKAAVPGYAGPEVKNITENMNVNQGKLSLGFRTSITSDDPEYYALLVYNSILGGGIHSKLFRNVRESAGLAYYAFSRLEKFKGLMVVSSGIEAENKDKAREIILKQIDEIKNGNITDYEFEAAVKTIETGINSLKDSQMQIVDFYFSQLVANTTDTLDSIIEKVKKVTKAGIVAAARKINLDTVYFLEHVNL